MIGWGNCDILDTPRDEEGGHTPGVSTASGKRRPGGTGGGGGGGNGGTDDEASNHSSVKEKVIVLQKSFSILVDYLLATKNSNYSSDAKSLMFI